MEPPYNEPLYNEFLGLTNDFLYPVIVQYMKKYLDLTKPRYSEQILPVPWHFVKSRFHGTLGSRKSVNPGSGLVSSFINDVVFVFKLPGITGLSRPSFGPRLSFPDSTLLFIFLSLAYELTHGKRHR